MISSSYGLAVLRILFSDKIFCSDFDIGTRDFKLMVRKNINVSVSKTPYVCLAETLVIGC